MNTAKFAGKEILKMFPIPLLNIRSSCDNIYCWITGTDQIWWAPVANDDGGNNDDDDDEVLISSPLCWRIIS